MMWIMHINKDFLNVTKYIKKKALELIQRLRKVSYNHTYYGSDMAIDEETAVALVEEIFGMEESQK